MRLNFPFPSSTRFRVYLPKNTICQIHRKIYYTSFLSYVEEEEEKDSRKSRGALYGNKQNLICVHQNPSWAPLNDNKGFSDTFLLFCLPSAKNVLMCDQQFRQSPDIFQATIQTDHKQPPLKKHERVCIPVQC